MPWEEPAWFFVEATAVTDDGRITHGDLGIWSDAHVAPLARIAAALKAQDSAADIQVGHAGRRATVQWPWEGGGPLSLAHGRDGDPAWQILAPSPVPHANGWPTPSELSIAEIDSIRASFQSAARRAAIAGFDVFEIHMAHGFLLHSFLSPLSNLRDDAYGGDARRRTRFPCKVLEAVRKVWPADRPLFVRLSALDGVAGGRTLADTIERAGILKGLGVDVIDCSYGGIVGAASENAPRPAYCYLAPLAAAIRQGAEVATMAIGLIVNAYQAKSILASGQADIVAVGREMLVDPNWAHTARSMLDPGTSKFEGWPAQFGWWLAALARSLSITAQPLLKA